MIAKLLSGVISRRSCQSSFNSPASLDTVKNHMSTPSHLFSPSTDALSLPLPLNKGVTPSVAGVLFGCRPPNVSRRIVAVCINAVELVSLAGVLTYLCPYLSSKRGILVPFVKDFNPSFAVIFKGINLGVVTAFFHTNPTCMERGSNVPVRFAFPSGCAHQGKGGLQS